MADQKFIRLQPILDIIQTAIWTGNLADEKPISAILIAKQESAKSQALLHFRDTPTMVFFTDVTTKPLDSIKDKVERKEIRHIVLLDLVRIVSHQRYVSDRTIQALAGLMEEGQATVADAGGFQEWKGLPTVGVLMAITPEYFHSKRGKWRDTGFLTRFLPVYFDYCMETVIKIHTRLSAGYRLPQPRKELLQGEPFLVSIAQEQSTLLRDCAIQWGLSNKVYGFRHHTQLRALAKALAALDGANAVEQKHIDRIIAWRPFFSVNEPAIL